MILTIELIKLIINLIEQGISVALSTVMVLGFLMLLVWPCVSYRKSSYYKCGKTPLIVLLFDKGKRLEYNLYKRLKKYEKNGAKLLFNCYLPSSTGTTEADAIMLTPTDIIVFECKNYAGVVTGDVTDENWTVSLGNEVHEFLNPIAQNRSHIWSLKNRTGIKGFVHSVVVFGDAALNITAPEKVSFKDSAAIVHLNGVRKTVDGCIRKDAPAAYNVNALYDNLLPLCNVSRKVKKEHVKKIENIRFLNNYYSL